MLTECFKSFDEFTEQFYLFKANKMDVQNMIRVCFFQSFHLLVRSFFILQPTIAMNYKCTFYVEKKDIVDSY